MSFKAFMDDTASYQLDELTFENNSDRVAMYGSLNISKDKVGLTNALELQRIVNEMVQVLQDSPDLPEKIALKGIEQVDNPFA